jgi:hypothetical protein
MNGERKISDNIWWGLAVGVALTLLISLSLITLVAAGVFDPKPLGPTTFNRNLQSLLVDQESESSHWIEYIQPEGNYSIRLTAHKVKGESDIGYGLVLGEPGHELIFAVSPLGYLSFWREREENDRKIEELYIPWRTWPHIQAGTDLNEIWLDVENDLVTAIRINQELLNTGPVSVPGQAIGIWLRTFGDPTEVSIDRVQIFEERN